jgi:DNA-binding XRE family transcriptional regulator
MNDDWTALRKAAGWNTATAARAVGVSIRTVQRWEAGSVGCPRMAYLALCWVTGDAVERGAALARARAAAARWGRTAAALEAAAAGDAQAVARAMGTRPAAAADAAPVVSPVANTGPIDF